MRVEYPARSGFRKRTYTRDCLSCSGKTGQHGSSGTTASHPLRGWSSFHSFPAGTGQNLWRYSPVHSIFWSIKPSLPSEYRFLPVAGYRTWHWSRDRWIGYRTCSPGWLKTYAGWDRTCTRHRWRGWWCRVISRLPGAGHFGSLSDCRTWKLITLVKRMPGNDCRAISPKNPCGLWSHEICFHVYAVRIPPHWSGLRIITHENPVF